VVKTNINIADTLLNSKLVKNFLKTEELNGFYSFKNEIKNYEDLIKKRSSFPVDKRLLLNNVVLKQYKNIRSLGLVSKSIDALKNPKTFTITTGHQLCLNTGPIYFFYKILHCIKISVELKKKYPKYNFVPVFWMASEDHDFEEIKSFETKNKKFEISSNDKNFCTGRIKPKNLNKIISELEFYFQNKPFKDEIISLFKKAYNKDLNLSESTRLIVHSLFKDYGLISIDADDHKLKSSFKEILIDEVNNFTCHNYVSATNDKISALLDEKIKFQVNPRKLNLFLIKDNKRYRLEYAKNSYNAVGSNLSFKKGEILEIINKNPEMFSPNVLMRPIYQEFLLPNLSYVGGGAEISYWLQLKSLFDYYKIPFPILTLRNSILLLNRRDIDFIDKNNIQISDLLRSKSLFIKNIINSNFKDNLNLDYEKKELKSIFKSLLKTATHVDKNLEAFVKSNETKQFKMVDSIEKKIIKSYKRKIEDLINSCEKIYDKAHPDGILQERKINFSEYYSFIGKKMIKNIYDSIIPFDNKLIVIEI